MSYENISVNHTHSILIPGGHAKGMKTMLKNETLLQKISQFYAQNRTIGNNNYNTLIIIILIIILSLCTK